MSMLHAVVLGVFVAIALPNVEKETALRIVMQRHNVGLTRKTVLRYALSMSAVQSLGKY